MPRTNFYDVIIIGGLPAALMAGGLLRRRKYRTLLINQAIPSKRYLHNGISIPSIPTLLPPRGHAPVFEQNLQTMNIEDPVHKLGIDYPLNLQVVTPDNRIDIPSELHAFEHELKRAIPEESSQTMRTLSRIVSSEEHYQEYLETQTEAASHSFRSSSKLRKLIRNIKLFAPPELEQWPELLRILAAGSTFTTNVDYQTRSIFTTGHLILGLMKGLRFVPGFQKLLSDGFKKMGGELESDMIVEEIDFEGKNPVGITTLRQSMSYKCTTLLAASSIRHTLELIPLKKRRRSMRVALDSIRTRLSLFTINFVLPKEILPMGMGNHLLMVRDPAKPLLEDNLIRIMRLPFPENQESALLNFSCLVSYRKRSLGLDYIETIRQRLLDAADWLIPFFKKNLQEQSSPFLTTVSDTESSSPSPWKLHQVLETTKDKSSSETVIPLSTPYRNMFFCGPESMPALGLEGSAQAAHDVVDLIYEQNKIKKIL